MTLAAPSPPVAPDTGPAPTAPADETPDLLRSPLGAALAVVAGWVVLLSWRGLVEDPGRVTRPLLIGAVLIGVAGWAVRRWTGSAWAALSAQLLVLLVWTTHRATGTWLPTPGAVRDVVAEVAAGIKASQVYYSPVPVQHAEFHFMLVLAGLGIVLAVDLLACGLRQPAIAGLPLLLAITVAASILLQPISLLVFAVTALCWMALIALREAGRLGPWSPVTLAPTATVIGVVAVLVAVFFTSGLGSEGRLFQNSGPGGGDGPGDALNVTNPLLDMRRNLRQERDVPVIDVETVNDTGTVPSYVRLAVLDSFNGASWFPTSRNTSTTRPVRGPMPFPVGMARSVAGPDRAWVLTVRQRFRSTWLPLPVPVSRIEIGPQWRYDPRNLDVSSSSSNASDMRYRADTFDVTVDPARMRVANRPPDSIRSEFTALPKLPTIFRQTANAVTERATNDWDRAVLLQDWFRSDGDFTYSTAPASGNGISTLQRFITTDRVGYCEQFATAMATLARTLGIPARVSVGFLRSEPTGEGRYTFSSQDLHAWPELYFEGVGWVRFEPTPGGRTGDAPPYTDSQVSSAPSQQPSQAPSAQPSVPTASPTATDPNRSSGGGASDWLRWVLGVAGALLLAALAAVPWLLRRTGRNRRWARATDPRALADAAWADVRDTSLDLDLGWSETASVRVNGARVQEAVAETGARTALGEVVRIVELTRYAGAHGAGPITRERLQADVERWRAAAYDEADPRLARRARWWPARR